MATAEDKAAARSCRDEADALARTLGHDLSWRLGRDSNRRGSVYHWCGYCWTCKAEVIADAGGSSCASDRDARVVRCEKKLLRRSR